MALTLGSLTSDSVQAVATYIAQNANSIAAAGDEFIQGLADSKDQNFQIGDLPTLGYLTVDDGVELAIARNTRVIAPNLSLTAIDAKIDQLTALEVPAAPDLDTPTVNLPELDASAPILSMPDRPDSHIDPAPTDTPDIQDVQPPTAPVVTLPNVPTFEELQLPTAPSFSLPTFTSQMPENLLVAPTNTFDYVDPGYTSELQDPLVAKLLDNLLNGGYGIETADEQALWSRARDRAEQEAKAAVDQAGKDAVSTSFPMPQGAYFARLDKARQALQEKMSEINREIALKRADMYVENRKFTIQEVQRYEQMMINLYNAMQERALNFAKETVQLGIAIYDASVRNFNAQLEAYKTEASVFEARIRAELAKAELFKNQIEAEGLRAQFNQTKVNLYVAQLQGVNQVVNLYKSRIDAANLLSQLQQQKLDAFKQKVTIFAEKVRAKQAEYDMYTAGIRGELAKVEVYKNQVDAYNSRVGAEEAKARVTLQSNEALLQRYNAAIRQYAAQLEGFAKTVDARLEKAKTQIQGYSVDSSVYRAYVDALLKSADMRVATQQMNNNWNATVVNSQVKAVEFRLQQLQATVQNKNDINKWGAEYFRTALGSTLASLSGLSVKTSS